jgi:hypothetical protein
MNEGKLKIRGAFASPGIACADHEHRASPGNRDRLRLPVHQLFEPVQGLRIRAGHPLTLRRKAFGSSRDGCSLPDVRPVPVF